jgi:hypothetical protein
MGYMSDKAAPKRTNGDTVPSLVAKPSAASNQVQFTTPNVRTPAMGPQQGHAVIGPNTKGTGRAGLESSIALSGKRKFLPDNH